MLSACVPHRQHQLTTLITLSRAITMALHSARRRVAVEAGFQTPLETIQFRALQYARGTLLWCLAGPPVHALRISSLDQDATQKRGG